MDSVDFDNVKAEKANAIRRYNRLRSITRLFRLVEACLALVFLSWTFTRLPFAVKISGEFLRKLAGVVASPLFVFVLCNAIIAALIAKSGKFFGENIDASNADAELYEELIKSSENRAEPLSEDAPLSTEEEEIVYQDKEMIISEAIATSRTCGNDTDNDFDFVMDSDPELELYNPKVCRRSKSEKLERGKPEKEEVRLRRSETEKFMKSDRGEKTAAEGLYPEDELSNEEFQRTIEEFIAKQLMFRRQESLAVVLHNQA